MYYSWSEHSHQGTCGYYSAERSTQTAPNDLNRGKRLSKRIPFRADSAEQAEQKVIEIMFREEISEVITADIRRVYQNKPVSLKTYWFCHRAEFRQKRQYDASVTEALFQNDKLAEFMSDREYTLQDYQEQIDTLTGLHPEISPVELLTQLNLILENAKIERRFIPNPVGDYLSSLREKDPKLRDIRAALAKKTFSQEEERKMLAYLSEQLPADGVAVGCAIRFYTGMLPGEICGLNWGDLHLLPNTPYAQFWVMRVLAEDNKETQDIFSRETVFRRVPLAEPLVEILMQRKAYVEKFFEEMEGREFDKLPLVIQTETSPNERCPLPKLAAATRKVVASAGVPSEVVPLGDNETDLNKYQGDIFRTNFKYRALQTCKMSVAELNYILGLAMPDTFSKHYCDYTNDFVQVLLCKKIERWTVQYRKRGKAVSTMRDVSVKVRPMKLSFHDKNDIRVKATIALKISPNPDEEKGSVELEINSDAGIDLTMTELKKS